MDYKSTGFFGAFMKYTWLLGVVGAIALAAGCGGDERPPVIDDGTGMGGKSTGKGGGSSAGKTSDDGGEGGMAALDGIEVHITAPQAASDPNTDEVLVDTEVKVVCSVKATESDVMVDGSSVAIEVLDATGDVAVGQDDKPLSAKGAPTGEANEYSASFVLTNVATGVVSFHCSAASIDKANGGQDTVATFIDRGPTIVAKQPEVDSAHALKGVMPIEFSVTPSPLSADDEGAEVTSVTLSVAGAEIEAPVLAQDSEDPTIYRAEIDFTDPVLFKDPPPEHTAVHIEAVNARKPKAATAINDYPIVVDGKGPDIAYVAPLENATVHGETVIEFTVTDSGAGLDLDTLELSLTGVDEPFTFDATKTSVWTKTGDKFKFRFDSLQLETVAYQINVSIRAQDRAGNATDGKSLVLNKDDRAPVIDLDPGNARGFNAQGKCSLSFDPLYDALNDGQKVNVSSNMLRAVVYDMTNTGSGPNTYYMSGTNRGSVRLYFQPNPSQPLLKDTNEDGVCDALAREDFKYVSLAPLRKDGSLSYGPDETTEPAVAGVCSVLPTSGPSTTLCGNTSDMYAVIQHDVETSKDEPIVYAYAPAASGFECTGKKLDLHNYTADPAQGFGVSLSPDGWVCMAVRAQDNLGNVGISRPLRVCLDDPAVTWPGDGQPECMKGAPPPSCLDSCTPPPSMPAHIYRF
jgi:hypothetical protein